MSGKDYLAPTTRGRRDPLDNGTTNSFIVQPPRFMDRYGGLTRASKIGKRNTMTVKKPGSTEHY